MRCSLPRTRHGSQTLRVGDLVADAVLVMTLRHDRWRGPGLDPQPADTWPRPPSLLHWLCTCPA